MANTDVIKFMDGINSIINFLEQALQKPEQIINFQIEDIGDIIRFSLKRYKYDVSLLDIPKMDEDSLRIIYSSIIEKYNDSYNLGATSTFNKEGVTWNLAPIIGENTLVEFVSKNEKDQTWFYDELVKDSEVKGLK